jgi:hypothetical protein
VPAKIADAIFTGGGRAGTVCRFAAGMAAPSHNKSKKSNSYIRFSRVPWKPPQLFNFRSLAKETEKLRFFKIKKRRKKKKMMFIFLLSE